MLEPRRSLIAALFALPAALALPGRLLADTLPEIMPTAKKVGEARFKVFLFKIYDAELFAPDGRFNPTLASVVACGGKVEFSSCRSISEPLA